MGVGVGVSDGVDVEVDVKVGVSLGVTVAVEVKVWGGKVDVEVRDAVRLGTARVAAFPPELASGGGNALAIAGLDSTQLLNAGSFGSCTIARPPKSRAPKKQRKRTAHCQAGIAGFLNLWTGYNNINEKLIPKGKIRRVEGLPGADIDPGLLRSDEINLDDRFTASPGRNEGLLWFCTHLRSCNQADAVTLAPVASSSVAHGPAFIQRRIRGSLAPIGYSQILAEGEQVRALYFRCGGRFDLAGLGD